MCVTGNRTFIMHAHDDDEPCRKSVTDPHDRPWQGAPTSDRMNAAEKDRDFIDRKVLPVLSRHAVSSRAHEQKLKHVTSIRNKLTRTFVAVEP